MNLFGLSRKNQPANDRGPSKDQYLDLEDRVRSLEHAHKGIALEWEAAYDKIHAAVQRLNKRARDLAKAQDPPESTIADTAATPTSTFRDSVLSRRRRHG